MFSGWFRVKRRISTHKCTKLNVIAGALNKRRNLKGKKNTGNHAKCGHEIGY